ncbi:MAG: hypothetical protein FWF44_03550 [Defluviitaleaceae bacterium]|nr:hypothetical protein [Defluviitaleaceae bacterium]
MKKSSLFALIVVLIVLTGLCGYKLMQVTYEYNEKAYIGERVDRHYPASGSYESIPDEGFYPVPMGAPEDETIDDER